MLKRIFSTSVFSVLVLLSRTTFSSAEDISQSDIIQKLSKKKLATRSLTRSLSAPKSAISKGDQQFLGSIGGTRGIKFMAKPADTKSYEVEPAYKPEDLAKIEKVVTKYDLPKLDFDIRFDFGSAQVSGASISQVVELAKALNHPSLADTRVILGGHTDAKGSDSFNQTLSQQRSDSVARLVVQIGGVKPDRIVPVGFGEHKLKNANDPHAAENRRVEVINISTN